MKHKISGNELRDRLLSRLGSKGAPAPTEETRIEALSSPGNRELMGIIATKRPQSIGELSVLAGRLQPNVSRSLSALARAGLLTVIQDGRASIPTLTPEGRRKAEDLHLVAPPAGASESTSSSPIDAPLLSAEIAEADNGIPDTDEVQANVVVRFSTSGDHQPADAHAWLNLNEVCASLTANWWRVLCRRGSPYKLFPLSREVDRRLSRAMLLIESAGRIELFVRPLDDDRKNWEFPRLSLTAEEFTKLALSELVHPLVERLRARKRFDRPVESNLRRLDEILRNAADLAFWRCAGALGLSYQTMNDEGADDVGALMSAISEEDARLEFASAVGPGQLRQSLWWAAGEVAAKAKINRLPRLAELGRGTANDDLGGVEPWRIGTERARNVRKGIGLAQDLSVNGLPGLIRLLGGDDRFAVSAAGDELIRGYLGHRGDDPVVVVRDEGPRNTAFLASRAVGDYLVYGSPEAPVADIYSNRQAVGRAFAAEFMAPARGVIHMIDEEHVSLDSVAEHYGVSRKVVRLQYENNVAQYAGAA